MTAAQLQSAGAIISFILSITGIMLIFTKLGYLLKRDQIGEPSWFEKFLFGKNKLDRWEKGAGLVLDFAMSYIGIVIGTQMFFNPYAGITLGIYASFLIGRNEVVPRTGAKILKILLFPLWIASKIQQKRSGRIKW